MSPEEKDKYFESVGPQKKKEVMQEAAVEGDPEAGEKENIERAILDKIEKEIDEKYKRKYAEVYGEKAEAEEKGTVPEEEKGEELGRASSPDQDREQPMELVGEAADFNSLILQHLKGIEEKNRIIEEAKKQAGIANEEQAKAEAEQILEKQKKEQEMKVKAKEAIESIRNEEFK